MISQASAVNGSFALQHTSTVSILYSNHNSTTTSDFTFKWLNRKINPLFILLVHFESNFRFRSLLSYGLFQHVTASRLWSCQKFLFIEKEIQSQYSTIKIGSSKYFLIQKSRFNFPAMKKIFLSNRRPYWWTSRKTVSGSSLLAQVNVSNQRSDRNAVATPIFFPIW